MDWRTNLHPDGHIYLHGMPYSVSHPRTIYNRVIVENTSNHNLHIGKIRFFPLDKSKAAHYGKLIYGLTDDGILEPSTSLMVYFFQSSSVGYGYQGKLEIPVLGSRTGIHAHIFTHAVSQNQSIKPIGVHSGVFPVFIFEGLKLSLDPEGGAERVKPNTQDRGEHLQLTLDQVYGYFNGGPDDPPKSPRITVVWSYNPIFFGREDLQKFPVTMEAGGVIPILQPTFHLSKKSTILLDGGLEVKKKTSLYVKEYLKKLPPTLEVELVQKKKTDHSVSYQVLKKPVELLNGELIVKSYSDIPIHEETHLVKHPVILLNGELNT